MFGVKQATLTQFLKLVYCDSVEVSMCRCQLRLRKFLFALEFMTRGSEQVEMQVQFSAKTHTQLSACGFVQSQGMNKQVEAQRNGIMPDKFRITLYLGVCTGHEIGGLSVLIFTFKVANFGIPEYYMPF